MGSGKEVSYVSYYKDQYDLTIQHHDQPLLVSRPRRQRVPGQRARPPPGKGEEGKHW